MKSAAKSYSSGRPCIAVLLAGGSGSRYNQQLPKQFSLLNGRPLFYYALDAFNACAQIDEIRLIVPAAMEQKATELADKGGWNKLRKPFIHGGRRRCDSCHNALKALVDYPSDSCILVHDVARPLISSSLIARSVAALATCSAVSAALPVTDTLAEVDKNRLLNIIPRLKYHQLQTPQGFSLRLLLDAYRSFYAITGQREGLPEPTDDCSIVRSYDKKISIELVPGEVSNIKLTHPEDLQLIESFLK